MAEQARLTIFADDLTGALDCAAAFASNGNRTIVVPGYKSHDPTGYDVVSIDMDTRRLRPEIASNMVYVGVLHLSRLDRRVRFVKIDSTLRGHPGIEIGATAAASSAAITLIAPSFPATGRTVRYGLLDVRGVPLAATEVGKDPLSPVSSSSVVDVLAEHSRLPISKIALDEIRSGRLHSRLAELTSDRDGPFLVVCDAETDEDLDSVVEAGLRFESFEISVGAGERKGVVFAGSAGLASALARQTVSAGASGRVESPNFTSPILLITASQRTLAEKQIEALSATLDVESHYISIDVTPDGTSSPATLDRETMSAALESRRDIAIRAVASGDLNSMSLSAVRKAADSIAEQLGQLVASLVSQHQIGGIVIIGGDTARETLLSMEADGIVLAAEPLPGVAVGTVSGGKLDRVTIATKAGAFGDSQTLVELFNKLIPNK